MLHKITFTLLVIGGLNWLLAAFGYGIDIFFMWLPFNIIMLVYILIGLSAVYELVMHKKMCKMCNPNIGKQ